MTDKDTELLENFFQAAAQQQIADNGFSDRVMDILPETKPIPAVTTSPALRLSRLWTWGCIALGVVLFIVFQGWNTLFVGIEVFLRTAPTEMNPMALPICLVAGTGLIVAETLYRERFA